ncbi:MAG: L-2-hydroxyglutarate oxidase [Bacteroidetes bacterium]|nr:L-2-hydroxyglutarate oxidase [Bacteroidota bacterium]
MFDIVIVGGGIVGLAAGFKIKQAQPKLKIVILEKEDKIASHQTGHNSGVIHSGLYYKPGSLKAQNCIAGYHELLDFCDQQDIAYDICGKIVVATHTEQLGAMENLYMRGVQNGLKGIKKLTKDELKEYEPYVNGIAGLHVPQTGIIDYSRVANKIADNFFELDGMIATSSRVTEINVSEKVIDIITSGSRYESKILLNCAGLYADKVAEMTGIETGVRIIPFRGEYFKVRKEKEHLVRNLIYPVPNPDFPFLGVHFTRMINGGIEAGPNAVLAFKREGYSKSQFNLRELYETLTWPGFRKIAATYWQTGLGEMYRSFSKRAFTTALQQLLPDILAGDLEPGGAGVRAQACDKDGGLIDDFVIAETKNVINVLNAPSPAATSALSIGKTLAQKTLERL